MNVRTDLRRRGDRHSRVEAEDQKNEEDELEQFLSIVGTEYVEKPPSDFDDDDFSDVDFDFGDDEFDFDDEFGG